MKKIRLLKSWRPGGWHPHGYTLLFHPSLYRVPEDISAELAERAVAEGVAERIEVDKAAEAEPSPPPPPHKAKPHLKAGAPENKVLTRKD